VVLAGVAVVGGVVLVGLVAMRPTGTEGGAAGLIQAAPIVGAAALAIAAGVALRSGAIPFHLWAARVADIAPAAALPLLLAWTPIILAAVAVAAWDAHVAPLGLPLDAERLVLVGVGVLTLVAGTLAALVQDDLEHVVGYLVIADGGLVLFGLATADPASVAPSLAWLVVLAASKSALGAWAVAIASRFGSRRLPELRGWARRSPILGGALLVTAIATFGLPGWPAWELRRELTSLATGGAWAGIVWLATLTVVIPYARILGAGLDRPTSTVAGVAGDRPVLTPMPPVAGRPARAAALEVGGGLAAALRANRSLVVSALALAGALLAIVVAAGGFELADAASAVPPAVHGRSSG
jgi:formate hydrogenlyase subunit 3/multisubunit Na+/H+ antiporter MnhD subunit